jgi:hypothetical protein
LRHDADMAPVAEEHRLVREFVTSHTVPMSTCSALTSRLEVAADTARVAISGGEHVPVRGAGCILGPAVFRVLILIAPPIHMKIVVLYTLALYEADGKSVRRPLDMALDRDRRARTIGPMAHLPRPAPRAAGRPPSAEVGQGRVEMISIRSSRR